MRDKVDLQSIMDTGFLNSLRSHFQTDDFSQREQMDTPQVEIGIRRRKSVKVSTADRGEQKGIRMLGYLVVQSWVDIYGSSSDNAARRALTSKAFAFS